MFLELTWNVNLAEFHSASAVWSDSLKIELQTSDIWTETLLPELKNEVLGYLFVQAAYRVISVGANFLSLVEWGTVLSMNLFISKIGLLCHEVFEEWVSVNSSRSSLCLMILYAGQNLKNM
jgi:hypothetical protein